MRLKQFEKQQYLNIETFRKNGKGVKTPVWFAEDGGTLLIWTAADSGKAKRIRRDGKVRVAPSTASGEPIGEWVNAQAIVDEDAATYAAEQLRKKYGIMFNMFAGLGKARGTKYTAIKVDLN
jgi:PPOX class probable F420-dependent enzyme